MAKSTLRFTIDPASLTDPTKRALRIDKKATSQNFLDIFAGIELQQQESLLLDGVGDIPLTFIHFQPADMQAGEVAWYYNYSDHKGLNFASEHFPQLPGARLGALARTRGSEAVISIESPRPPRKIRILGHDNQCISTEPTVTIDIERKRQKAEVTIQTQNVNWMCERQEIDPAVVRCRGTVNQGRC